MASAVLEFPWIRWILHGKTVTVSEEWRLVFRKDWSTIVASGCSDDIANLADLDCFDEVQPAIFNMDEDFPPIQ